MFNSALDKIFGVKKYADSLMKIVNKRDIKLNFKRNLVEVNADKKEAIFEILDPTTESSKYETYEVCVTVCGHQLNLVCTCKCDNSLCSI